MSNLNYKRLQQELHYLQVKLGAELNNQDEEMAKEENNPEIISLRFLIEVVNDKIKGR